MSSISILCLLAICANGARLPSESVTMNIPSTIRDGTPRPPDFPDAYEMQYTLAIPYVETFQTAGLKYPVHMWYDREGARMRVDVYNGLDSIYILPDFTYNVFPRITKKSCLISNTSQVGPTKLMTPSQRRSLPGFNLRDNYISNPLPDISNWTFAGESTVNDVASYAWQFVDKHDDKVNTYTFYTSQHSQSPLKLYMMGVNLFTGSHYDEYIVEFSIFRRLSDSWATDNAFKPPLPCNKPIEDMNNDDGQHELRTAQMLSLLPSSNIGVDAPAAFSTKLWTGSSSSSGIFSDEHQDGLKEEQTLFESSQHFVSSWNEQYAEDRGFKLATNKFSRISHAQFQASYLGLNRARQAEGSLRQRRQADRGVRMFQRRLTDDQLPENVDWRGTGADGFVKDQVSCGSCWAFAAAGAMQGAWFVATGEPVSLSEQQSVDCSWDLGSNGCWGGFVEDAIDTVVAAGGAVSEEAYPYLGQNSNCRINKTAKSAYFSGYEKVPTRDERALMEAVYTRGPVAVELDAAHPTFKYYSEGVYYRENCFQDEDHLDHAVLLVGYGTTESGEDYWLIRNSWSKYWGMDGYIKISRKGNDCGVSTNPVMAVVDPGK